MPRLLVERELAAASFLPLIVGLLACSDGTLSTAPDVNGPRFEIADAARAYKNGFYWLPPMVSQPSVTGTFDVALTPTVEICELAADGCGPVIATYTTTAGPNGELLRLEAEDQQYHVNWHTNEFDLSTTKIYRMSVYAGLHGTLLGYSDIQPVSSGGGLRNVDTEEYIGLVDGRTLPIKFRIETGIVGNITVEPVEAEAEPGATQQFVATARDLHGDVMSVDVTWATSDEGVATVDQSGLAGAIADGQATITATTERITGSATLVVEGTNIVALAGGNHSCALDDEGRAYCWGLGTSGQIGNGSLATRQRTPVPVSGGHRFASLALGRFHTCGIALGGEAYCWGNGFDGELGNGSTAGRSTPVAVSGGLTFVAITAGANHTCAMTDAGQAYCWGGNAAGQLGNGETVTRRTTPVPVSGGLTFAALSAGTNFTCGLTTERRAYCWGSNLFATLGSGPGGDRRTPVPVSGNLTFLSISSGDTHVCGITAEGPTYCWGIETNGRLGNGRFFEARFTPVLVLGGIAFESISAGGAHVCAVTGAGILYCWGSNLFGQLGIGSMLDQHVPARVAGEQSFASISAGLGFTCAVTTADEIYCWGLNTWGQVGDGSTLNRLSPVLVAPLP